MIPTQNPLVSVIIPTFNRPQKLERCLETVLRQTHSNLEVFVIDDASKKAFEYSEDSRVKVIRNVKNLGPGSSRNIGMQHATGQFVVFLDSDDYWELDFLETAVAALIQNPAAAMAYVNGYEVDENGKILGIRRNKIKQLDCILPEILSVNRHWGTGGCLWRKKDIQNIEWIASRTWEDYAFDIDVAIHNNTVVGVKEKLVYYDISGKDKLSERISNDFMSEKILALGYISKALYASNWRSHPKTKKALRYIFLMNFLACSNPKDKQLLSQGFNCWNGFFGRILWKVILKLPESRKVNFLELLTRIYRKQIR